MCVRVCVGKGDAQMGKGEPQPAGFLGSLDVDQEKALDGLKVALVELHFPESGLEEEHVRIVTRICWCWWGKGEEGDMCMCMYWECIL